jgi:hypothetical protein
MHIILERETAVDKAIDWCIAQDVAYTVLNNWPNPNAIFSLNTSDDTTISAFLLQFYNGTAKIWRS